MGKDNSITTDLVFLIFDYLEKIGASLDILAFLKGREQLKKAEMKEAQILVQLENIKQAIQITSYKKVHQIRNEFH